ncbi:MAG: hypothetical protein Q8O33_04450 [Pseudomonadota bacterium]|nr:hypothetical protein [Pseudomonadota bacterium]
MPDLIIAGVHIPIEALGDHNQSYDDEAAGGTATLTLADGSQITQTRYRKLTTTLAASGWVPPGLPTLVPGAPVVLSCVGRLAVGGASRVITLPAARRGDAPLIGQATVAGRMVATAVESVVGHVATLAAVPGASSYAALYYPEFLAHVTITRDVDVGQGFGWRLTAREA